MSDSLGTYLHDHLSGANFAVELLQFLCDEHAGKPLGAFAAEMLAEVEADRHVLQGIAERAGADAPIVKEAAAWVGEKISRLKLSRGEFGTFEALEALELGLTGKLALWRALAAIGESDHRVRGVDYDKLAARAQSQRSLVESRRLQAAKAAFTQEK